MKRRSVGRPRDTDPNETRRAILKAAEECFAASGFAGATTRAVAARSGVNVATLHYHFGSKERLYRAALAAAAAAPPELASGALPAERLSATVGALFELGWTHPARARLSLLDRLAGPARAAEGDDPRAALLARTIAEAAPDAPLAPEEAARLVLVLLDAALVAVRNGSADASAPLRAAREAVVAAALRAVGLG